jgi:hypothetical protein
LSYTGAGTQRTGARFWGSLGSTFGPLGAFGEAEEEEIQTVAAENLSLVSICNTSAEKSASDISSYCFLTSWAFGSKFQLSCRVQDRFDNRKEADGWVWLLALDACSN